MRLHRPPSPPDAAPRPQVLRGLCPEFTASGDVNRAIDRLVRDPHSRITWMVSFERYGDLFGRPIPLQSFADRGQQLGRRSKSRRLGSTRTLPRCGVCDSGTVSPTPTVAGDLPRYRRGRSSKFRCDRSAGEPSGDTARDLLALSRGQLLLIACTSSRSYTAVPRQNRAHCVRSAAEPLRDQPARLTPRPTLPQLVLQFTREHHPHLRTNTSRTVHRPVETAIVCGAVSEGTPDRMPETCAVSGFR